jgi:predicted aspartyl protease
MSQVHVRLAVSAALLLAGVPGPAATPHADACRLARDAGSGAALRVPFERVDGRIYVQAQVNGRGPFRFAVDTGASGLGRADARLVQALGLRMTGETPNSDGVRTATSATTRLDALALGSLVRTDVEVIARDYGSGKPEAQRFDGILGRDFFGDGLLVIDYPAGVLAFTTTAGLPADAPGSLAYERPFRVPAAIAGLAVTAHLDTGANVNAVLPKSLYDAVDASPLSAAAPGRLTNGTVDARRATLAGPLRIGGASLANLEVRVSETFPELLVGAHVLQHYLLAIDQRSKRVAVCAPLSGASGAGE